jgi:hypothetical protein
VFDVLGGTISAVEKAPGGLVVHAVLPLHQNGGGS